MKRLSVLSLLVFVGACLPVLLSFVGLQVWPATNCSRDLETRAMLTANSFDTILKRRMIETFTFAALPSFRGFASSDEEARPGRAAVARVELQAIVDADPNVRAVAIVDPTGIVALATDGSIRENWSDRVFVREAMRGQLYASAPSMDDGEVSLYYSAPILNNGGDVAGALVIRVAVQELWDILSSQQDVMLIDENGVRIADRTQSPLPFVALAPLSEDAVRGLMAEKHYGSQVSQIQATNLSTLAKSVQDSRETRVSFRDLSGRNSYAVISRLKVKPWCVVAFAHDDGIFQEWLGPIALSLTSGAAVAAIFILAFTALRGSRRQL